MVYIPVFLVYYVNMTKPHIKELFGKRLRQARKMEGLSLRALSDKIGGAVSHNALAKYERGEMMPDSTLLIALARALHQPKGFFFRPMAEEIQQVEFREKTKLGEKQEQVIRVKAQDHFDRYLEIEQILGIKDTFTNPLGKDVISSLDDIEDIAVKVRKKWKLGINPILNLTQALESNGIKILEISAPDEFEGFSGWLKNAPVVVINSQKNVLRKRHTLLHELGHLLLKGHLGNGFNEEKVVPRFAGAFTIPNESFVKAFGGNRDSLSLEELIEMKAEWGTSIRAIMVRANQLKLIPYALYRRFWETMGMEWKDSQGEDGDERYAGVEESTRFESLVYRALAEEMITSSKASTLLNINLDELNQRAAIFE